MFVAEQFTNQPGSYVKVKDTIKGMEMILKGECDMWPEEAFHMVGTIEDAKKKAMEIDGSIK